MPVHRDKPVKRFTIGVSESDVPGRMFAIEVPSYLGREGVVEESAPLLRWWCRPQARLEICRNKAQYQSVCFQNHHTAFNENFLHGAVAYGISASGPGQLYPRG